MIFFYKIVLIYNKVDFVLFNPLVSGLVLNSSKLLLHGCHSPKSRSRSLKCLIATLAVASAAEHWEGSSSLRWLRSTCWAGAAESARVTIISFGAVLSPIATTLVLLVLSQETLLRPSHHLIVLRSECLVCLNLPNYSNDVVGQHDAANDLETHRCRCKHNGAHRETKHH